MNVGELKAVLLHAHDKAEVLFTAPGRIGTIASVRQADVMPNGKVMLLAPEIEVVCGTCMGTGYINEVDGDDDEDGIPCPDCNIDHF